MEQYKEQKGKRIVPRGDPILHGNQARIDPQKDLVSDYRFYAVTQPDHYETEANLPIADWETVKQAKREVDANEK